MIDIFWVSPDKVNNPFWSYRETQVIWLNVPRQINVYNPVSNSFTGPFPKFGHRGFILEVSALIHRSVALLTCLKCWVTFKFILTIVTASLGAAGTGGLSNGVPIVKE